MVADEVCCRTSETAIEGGKIAQRRRPQRTVSPAAPAATVPLSDHRRGWHGPTVCRSERVLHDVLRARERARRRDCPKPTSEVPEGYNSRSGRLHRARRRSPDRKKGLRISKAHTSTRSQRRKFRPGRYGMAVYHNFRVPVPRGKVAWASEMRIDHPTPRSIGYTGSCALRRGRCVCRAKPALPSGYPACRRVGWGAHRRRVSHPVAGTKSCACLPAGRSGRVTVRARWVQENCPHGSTRGRWWRRMLGLARHRRPKGTCSGT